MGTNFYIKASEPCPHCGRADEHDRDDPTWHIGKRSAAGLYCWTCGITLCMAGEAGVHYSRHDWYDACPECGAKPENEALSESAAGRELGFNKLEPTRKAGVKTCASFTWAMTQDDFVRRAKAGGPKPIVDEYNRDYSVDEFKAVLDECPIQYTDQIGAVFS